LTNRIGDEATLITQDQIPLQPLPPSQIYRTVITACSAPLCSLTQALDHILLQAHIQNLLLQILRSRKHGSTSEHMSSCQYKNLGAAKPEFRSNDRQATKKPVSLILRDSLCIRSDIERPYERITAKGFRSWLPISIVHRTQQSLSTHTVLLLAHLLRHRL
jgi:hypothetical protein